jgi:molybdenum cofactor cytidylyltransferase
MGYFPKALLDSGDGVKFLEKILINAGNLTPAPSELIVILGFHKDKIEKEIDLSNYKLVINPDPGRGMLSSIIEGLSHIRDSLSKDSSYKIDGILLSLVDHPMVKFETYQKIISEAAINSGKIIIPICNERKGHPVFFPANIFEDLLNSPVDQGARWAVKKNEKLVKLLPVNDEHIYTDIDTPELYTDHCLPNS